MLDRKRIGEILSQLGVLSDAEVERVLTALRRRDDFAKFGQVAKDMGLIDEEQILAALAVQMELIPKAHDMTMSRILRQLLEPARARPKDPVQKHRR